MKRLKKLADNQVIEDQNEQGYGDFRQMFHHQRNARSTAADQIRRQQEQLDRQRIDNITDQNLHK